MLHYGRTAILRGIARAQHGTLLGDVLEARAVTLGPLERQPLGCSTVYRALARVA